MTNQATRLSYTKRDIDQIDTEIATYIQSFISTIKNTSTSNPGRIFLRTIAALLDKLFYSQDMKFRQSVLRTVKNLQSAQDIVELVRYYPPGVSSATVDLTYTTLAGPAGAGGISIAQYSQTATETGVVKSFITLEAASIPEGSSSISVSAIQGTRVVGQTLKASADGDPGEEVPFPVSKTPHDYIEVSVNGSPYTTVEDFKDSQYNDLHVVLKTDAELLTTAVFGDGEYGIQLSPGDVITATYIQSLGASGNTPAEAISVVIGSLSSTLSVTNPEAAAGGSDGDEVEDIVRKAPKYASSFARAVLDSDFEAFAEAVSGVYKAYAEPGDGAGVNLWIMPVGGGVASSAILTAVETALESVTIYGSVVSVSSLLPANIRITMNVVLQSKKVQKTVARNLIYETISAFKANGDANPDGALYYTNLTIGRGFTFSDMSALIEALEDDELVDYVDYSVFTRYPTPVEGSPAPTVEFQGDIVPSSVADYDSWSIQAATTTTFDVFKNGLKDSTGTVGVEHTTDDESITFTLGTSIDTFNLTDNWTFTTSAYRNNIRLSAYEFMQLAKDSDLEINIYYPGERSIGDE